MIAERTLTSYSSPKHMDELRRIVAVVGHGENAGTQLPKLITEVPFK